MSIELSPRLKAFFPKESSTVHKFYLGEFERDIRYTVLNANFGGQPFLFLRNGPTGDAPAIATLHAPTITGIVESVKITVRLRRLETAVHLTALAKLRRWFRMKIGQATEEERFEWRPSHGQEIRAIHPNARGWKLIRMGKEGPSGLGGEREARQAGESSDGKEVVAVWGTIGGGLIPSALKKGRKPFIFHLCGSAKTGELGEEFPIFALMMALHLYTTTEESL
ncbi:hypothetical protein Hte_008367 [Hypoxylon texense]